MKLPGLTERAARAVARLAAEYGPDGGRTAYMPIIGISESIDPIRTEVCLGFQDVGKIDPQCFVEAHGTKLAFFLSEERLRLHQNHVLDFTGNRFTFIPKDMAPFPEQD
jgi:hypothetical protein